MLAGNVAWFLGCQWLDGRTGHNQDNKQSEACPYCDGLGHSATTVNEQAGSCAEELAVDD